MSTPHRASAVHTRVLIVKLADSAIEWFDYFLYGSVAALVFNTLFFPNFDPVVGLLLSYLSFSLTFFVRRFAGVILFHVGDCIRHKMTLVLTLYACVPQMGVPLSMLLATLAIFCDRSSIHGNHAWLANRCDVAGATAPLVATWLLKQLGGSWTPVAIYVALGAALSFVSIAQGIKVGRTQSAIR